MIPMKIRQLLIDRGYSPRAGAEELVLARTNLIELGINPDSELGAFYLEYDPTNLQSNTSYEQLEDVVAPAVDDATTIDIGAWKTPVGMSTRFVREVWETPDNLLCLTTTEGEGAYLCDLKTGVIYDFSLTQQGELASGALAPRWKSFFEFLEWYLS